MDPVLAPLFQSVSILKGVGPKIAQLIEKIAGNRIIDLFFHLPNRVILRNLIDELNDGYSAQNIIIKVSVLKHIPPPRGRRNIPYRIKVEDESGNSLDLVFFKGAQKYIQNQLPEGARKIIAGQLDVFRGTYQITHPEHILEEGATLPVSESVYPVTAGLSAKTLTKTITGGLGLLPPLPEWLDENLLNKNGWTDWRTALITAHEKPGDKKALARLAYDEFLANQLTMALVRKHTRKQKGISMEGNKELRRMIMAALPFELTSAQKTSLAEIYEEMHEPNRMMRLLQGDVGSGKTVVALLAIAKAIEAGHQGVLMAPTEILARQHLESITEMVAGLGIHVICLTGRDKGPQRKQILHHIKEGHANIIIGTHALFQETVEFKNVGLVVIDEQHRFGVHQRLALSDKGLKPDVLVMTATPIPRTLLLTAYGDLDVSRLTDKPAGRKPIDTRLVTADRLDELTQSLKRPLQQGQKVYWVCPLVEESDKLDLADAENRHAYLKKMLGDKVGLIHGRMKGPDKDQIMEDFVKGVYDVLVATTVIEVGVNVPTATIMVIEHAERFGLSQLHQLRGRVGRGDKQSSCILLYKAPLGDVAKRRLQTMRDTEDGFVIAEQDFKLRGGGDILGTRQSGDAAFRLADLSIHGDLLQMARDDAALILNKDPTLTLSRGEALRHLLHLFERHQAVKYLSAG